MTRIRIRFADHITTEYQEGLMAELVSDMDAEVELLSPGYWTVMSRRERQTQSVISQLESEAREGRLRIEDKVGK